jgi:hypothetical protein
MTISLNGSGGITYPDGSVNTTRSVSTTGDTMTGTLTGTIFNARDSAYPRLELRNTSARDYQIFSSPTSDGAHPSSLVIEDITAGFARRLVIDSTGNIILPSGRIKFPATQNASTDPNTLDDYEEGTWTPTLSTTGTAPTVAYTNRSGAYTKIGNMVIVSCSVRCTVSSIGSGLAIITGLPFANAGYLSGVASGIVSSLNITPPSYSYVDGSTIYFSEVWRTTAAQYMTFTVSYPIN